MPPKENETIASLKNELTAAHATSATLATSVSQLTKVLENVSTSNAELRKENEQIADLKKQLGYMKQDDYIRNWTIEQNKDDMIELLQKQLQDLKEGKDNIDTSREIEISNLDEHKSYSLFIPPTTTIKTIRASLANTLGCDPNNLCLISGNTLLRDDYIIAAYGITDGAQLTYVLKRAQKD